MDKLVDGIATIILEIILDILSTAIACIIIGIIVTPLWNWLIPVLFHLSKITWLQGWGISFLCEILFKGTTTISNKD